MAAVPSIGRASLVQPPALAPEAAATEGLYARHSAKILGYCLHQLGSREEAEDAVQTTFMNAFRALARGVVPESESAWLFKIAENVCLSRRRSSWRRGRIESPSDFDLIEQFVPGPSGPREELIGIEDALASMPEQQRRAILLREWQGLSYREVAEELEVSQSAVETLIFRARRSLAQGLEQPELARPKRRGFRRALHVLDLGTLAAAAKALLTGSAAVKATAAAVAVTAAAGTAVTVTPKLDDRPQQATPPPAVASDLPAASARVVPEPSRRPLAAAPLVSRRPTVTPSPQRAPKAKAAATKAVRAKAPARKAKQAAAPAAAERAALPKPVKAAPEERVPRAKQREDTREVRALERAAASPAAVAPKATASAKPERPAVLPTASEGVDPAARGKTRLAGKAAERR